MLKNLMAAALGAIALQASAGLVLYDGANPATPQSQGSLVYYPFGAVTSTAGGKTSHDTTSDFNIKSGYSNYTALSTLVNPAFPVLDRNNGYKVRFDTRVISDDHTPSANRAGLSLIALSSDGKGIELGFWPDQVWAQETGFTKAESAPLDTTAAIKSYELTVLGNNYSVTANGLPLLSGALRAYGSPALPYAIPSYLFIGDDTTSAKGAFEFSYLSVEIPEPTGAILMLIGGVGMLRSKRMMAK